MAKKKKKKKKNTNPKKHTPKKSNIHTGYRIGALVLAAIIIVALVAMYGYSAF